MTHHHVRQLWGQFLLAAEAGGLRASDVSLMRRRNFLMSRTPPRHTGPVRTDGQAPFAPPWWDRPLPDPLPTVEYQPLSWWYKIRFQEPQEKSEGGIWLPGGGREVWTDGEVIAAGPGKPLYDGHRTVMLAEVGDRVLFMKNDVTQVDLARREGLVRDHDLVALQYGNYDFIQPCNEWCLIEQDAASELAGSMIRHAEEWAPKPCSGILKRVGIGVPRKSGFLQHIRRPIRHEWGFRQEVDNIIGKRVYWGRKNEALAVGRERLEFLLIRAGDLEAYSEV